MNGTAQPATEEAALVAAVLQKDRKAAAEFVDRYTDAIYGYVSHRLLPRADRADDIVQEVFLAAWRQLRDFRGDSSVTAWLLGIARHKVEDHYRARFREFAVLAESDAGEPEVPAPDPPLDDVLDRQEARRKARRILEALPETYATALLWRYWEERSIREIAAQSGKTEKAVERLLARAREEFKRRWQNG